jgi:cytochrome d ubiquinol oxidase subunit I
MLWALMLAFPFTIIANLAGWTVAETARQPWVVYNLQLTSAGASPEKAVPSGTGTFTLLGFTGLYVLVGLLYVFIQARIVSRGPDEVDDSPVAAHSEPAGA